MSLFNDGIHSNLDRQISQNNQEDNCVGCHEKITLNKEHHDECINKERLIHLNHECHSRRRRCFSDTQVTLENQRKKIR